MLPFCPPPPPSRVYVCMRVTFILDCDSLFIEIVQQMFHYCWSSCAFQWDNKTYCLWLWTDCCSRRQGKYRPSNYKGYLKPNVVWLLCTNFGTSRHCVVFFLRSNPHLAVCTVWLFTLNLMQVDLGKEMYISNLSPAMLGVCKS